MKLYTEEQVKDMFNGYDNFDDITPIELPSGIVKVEIQHQYHSSKEFYSDAGFVNCTKEQYESIKTEIPTCPLNKLVKITPIEIPSDEEIEEKYYQELEERREVAKNYQGQVAGRHPDMFGNSEIHHMVRGYLEAIQSLRNKIQGGNK